MDGCNQQGVGVISRGWVYHTLITHSPHRECKTKSQTRPTSPRPGTSHLCPTRATVVGDLFPEWLTPPSKVNKFSVSE